VSQSLNFISDRYFTLVVVCFLRLFFFIVGNFLVLVLVLFLPLPLAACQDSWSSLSSLSVLSSASEKSAV
jgi:hypothetical protein